MQSFLKRGVEAAQKLLGADRLKLAVKKNRVQPFDLYPHIVEGFFYPLMHRRYLIDDVLELALLKGKDMIGGTEMLGVKFLTIFGTY